MIDYQYLNDQIKQICLAPGQADDCLAAIDSCYHDDALSSLCREYVGILTSGGGISPVKMSKFRFLARQIHLTEEMQSLIERYLSGDRTALEEAPSREIIPDSTILKGMSSSESESSSMEKNYGDVAGDSGRVPSISIPKVDFGRIWEFISRKAKVGGERARDLLSGLKRVRLSPQWDRRLLFILFKILAIGILIGVAIVGMKSLPAKKLLFLLVLVITGFGIIKTKSLSSLSGMSIFCCIWSLAIVMGVLLSAPLWLMLVFILGGIGYILYSSYF